MAKIKIEADTEEMTIECYVNDKKIENVHSISLYHMMETSYSKEKVEFSAHSEEKNEEGVRTMTYIMANNQLVKESSIKSNIKDQIKEYFNKKLNKN